MISYSSKTRLGLIAFVFLLANQVVSQQAPTQETVSDWMSLRTNQGFKENKGQLLNNDLSPANQVLYKAEIPGINLWITESGLTYEFFTTDKELLTYEDGTPLLDGKGRQEKKRTVRSYRIDMSLPGAQLSKNNAIPSRLLQYGQLNYYLAHCPNGIEGVKSYNEITFNNIYPGIDWKIYTTEDHYIKYDFIVRPGADPNQIKLIYEGSGDITFKANSILLSTELGEIEDGALYCYSETQEDAVSASYKVVQNAEFTFAGEPAFAEKESNSNMSLTTNTFSYTVGFDLGAYDKSKELIIDPQLTWGTLYGGNNAEGFMSIETDANGKVFVSGYASSNNFPLLNPAAGSYYQPLSGGNWDAFLVNFDNNGVLLWATYYGGNFQDLGNAVTVDPFGNVWMTGQSISVNFPLQNGGGFYQSVMNGPAGYGGGDLFLVKFDNAGVRQHATYFGGDGQETAHAIASDAFGNIFVTGMTKSTDFPILGAWTPFQSNIAGVSAWPLGYRSDAFLLKFDNTANLLWGSYYGGTKDETGYALAVDASNNVWVTGNTLSGDMPTVNGGGFFDGVPGGAAAPPFGDYPSDVFVLKFDNACNMQNATYAGGADPDQGYSMAADQLGNVWVSGSTWSTDFPLQDAGTYFQPTFGGATDIFLMKFDAGFNLTMSTYYGGSAGEHFTSYDNMAVDNCNNVYIGFESGSQDIAQNDPGLCNYFDGTYDGGTFGFGANRDAFIAMFNEPGDIQWTSFVGGFLNEHRSPVATDVFNNVFMGGEILQYDGGPSPLPIYDLGNGSYYNNMAAGVDDSYLLKFQATPLTTDSTKTNVTQCNPCNGQATVEVTCGMPPFSFTWSNGQQTIDTQSPFDTLSNVCPGTYTVIVNAMCMQADTITYVIDGPQIQAGTASATICQGDSILLAGAFQTQAGVYIDTLFGASSVGCDSAVATTLNVTPLPTAPTVASPDLCFNTSTTLTASAPGGTYDWFDQPGGNLLGTGASWTTPNLSTSTNYTVYSTMNGCTGPPTTITVNVFPEILIDAGPDTNFCTGSAYTMQSTASTPGLNYSWDEIGNPNFAQALNPTVTPIATGMYWLTATDANGCWAQDSVTLTLANSPAAAINGTQISCNAVCDGQLTGNGSGGTPPYNYTWIGNGAGATINNLCAGNYTLVVSDLNGCADTLATVLNEPTAIQVNTIMTDPLCNNDCNGSIVINAVGGTGVYQYSTDGMNFQAGQNFNGLCAGNFTITVQDNNGCTGTAPATLNNPAPLTGNVTTTDVSCNPANQGNSANGSIEIGASGGTGNYQFSIDNGTNLSSQGLFTNQLPGSYQVVVTDDNGCSLNLGNHLIDVPPAISIPNTVTDAQCFGDSNGEIVIAPQGGTPLYDFTWSVAGAGNSPLASGLAAGSVTVTVTDAAGCSQDSTFIVGQPAEIDYISFDADITAGCSPLQVEFNNTTDTSLISGLSWNLGNGQISSEDPTTTTYNDPGTYTVSLTITDNNGCTGTLTVPGYITVYDNPVADFYTSASQQSAYNPTFDFEDASYNDIIGWDWDFGGNGNSNAQNPSFTFPRMAGTYTITLVVENTYGCLDSTSKEVTVVDEPALYVPNAFTPDGDGINGTFKPEGVGIIDEDYRLLIFNRWGEQVFESQSFTMGWDGSYNGTTAKSDVYVWKLDCRTNNGTYLSKTGHVTLLR